MSDDPLAQWISQGHSSPMTDRGSASVVQIDSGKLVPLIIVLAILCGMSMALSVFALQLAGIAEREGRLAQYRADGMQKQMIANGFPDPGDDYSEIKKQRPAGTSP